MRAACKVHTLPKLWSRGQHSQLLHQLEAHTGRLTMHSSSSTVWESLYRGKDPELYKQE